MTKKNDNKTNKQKINRSIAYLRILKFSEIPYFYPLKFKVFRNVDGLGS